MNDTVDETLHQEGGGRHASVIELHTTQVHARSSAGGGSQTDRPNARTALAAAKRCACLDSKGGRDHGEMDWEDEMR